MYPLVPYIYMGALEAGLNIFIYDMRVMNTALFFS